MEQTINKRLNRSIFGIIDSMPATECSLKLSTFVRSDAGKQARLGDGALLTIKPKGRDAMRLYDDNIRSQFTSEADKKLFKVQKDATVLIMDKVTLSIEKNQISVISAEAEKEEETTEDDDQ